MDGISVGVPFAGFPVGQVHALLDARLSPPEGVHAPAVEVGDVPTSLYPPGMNMPPKAVREVRNRESLLLVGGFFDAGCLRKSRRNQGGREREHPNAEHCDDCPHQLA